MPVTNNEQLLLQGEITATAKDYYVNTMEKWFPIIRSILAF